MRRNFRDAQSSFIASSSYRCHDVIVTSSLACAREIAFGQTYRVTMNAHVGLRAARGGREAPYAVKISITLDLQALRHVTNRISTSRALRGSYDTILRIKWLSWRAQWKTVTYLISSYSTWQTDYFWQRKTIFNSQFNWLG